MKKQLTINMLIIGLSLFMLNACTTASLTPSPTLPPPVKTPVLEESVYHFSQLPVDEKNPGTWKLIRHIKKMDDEPIFFRAAFWDENFAVTVGRKKGIYISKDGGLTWQHSIEGFGSCGFGVEIVNPSILWGCARGTQGSMSGGGWDQSVRVSVNGGATWHDTTRIPTEYSHASARCWDLSFIDDQVGWVSSFNQISATQDGGLTWLDIPNPSPSVVVSIYVQTLKDVFLLDDTGSIFITSDGGQKWTQKSLGLQEGIKLAGWNEGFGSGTGVIRFADAKNGLVIANLMDEKTHTLTQFVEIRSLDGGQNWITKEISQPFGTLYLNRAGNLLTIVPFSIELTADEILVRQYQNYEYR